VQNALKMAGSDAKGTTNGDTFLTKISGIMYGDDPKQGMVEGRSFKHPEFRLAFDAPEGFALTNGAAAVSVSGQSGKGEFSTGSYGGNLDTYIRSVFTALAGEGQSLAPSSVTKAMVNGIPAAYGSARVNSGNGEVDVVVYAYEFANNQAFHFATITPAGQAAVFAPMYQSVRRLSATEAAAMTPRRLEVLTVRSGDTVSSLASRMAYSKAQVERFRVLNGLSSTDDVKAEQKVKIVVNAAR
jgi:predicted Zn-dependent protease